MIAYATFFFFLTSFNIRIMQFVAHKVQNKCFLFFFFFFFCIKISPTSLKLVSLSFTICAPFVSLTLRTTLSIRPKSIFCSLFILRCINKLLEDCLNRKVYQKGYLLCLVPLVQPVTHNSHSPLLPYIFVCSHLSSSLCTQFLKIWCLLHMRRALLYTDQWL